MNKFLDKKLLLLGTNVGSIEIVNYAKSEGAYVIVADNLPNEKSPAKLIADESLLISTNDIDALSKYVKDKNINGVFCGVSEFNIKNVKRICDAANLPCYFSWKHWNAFMDKGNFKHLCEKYNVPTPITFFSGTKDDYNNKKNQIHIVYPVIIKPTDCGANIGISICTKESDLERCLEIAFTASNSNQAIIEQYVEGIEISSTYVIQEDVCKMVCMSSKLAYRSKDGKRALANAHIYPSPVLDKFEQVVDEKIKGMILGEGLKNCTIFFQGIYDGNDFFIFESGLRMEGTATFRITEAICGQSFMHFMVDNVMDVDTNYNISYENPHFNGQKCILFSQISKAGVLTKIDGWDYIYNNPIIISTEKRHVIGSSIKEDGTLRQTMFRYVLLDDNEKRIVDTIRQIQKEVIAYDENGNNMIINNDFDPKTIFQ